MVFQIITMMFADLSVDPLISKRIYKLYHKQ